MPTEGKQHVGSVATGIFWEDTSCRSMNVGKFVFVKRKENRKMEGLRFRYLFAVFNDSRLSSVFRLLWK